jgi:hypothetical protein
MRQPLEALVYENAWRQDQDAPVSA